MSLPTLVVEIAFDDGPLEPDPTWTSVADDVRHIEISRSLGNDLDPSPPGTATVVLDNRTRVYDPSYSSGTYYGKLLPRRQIRIQATWDDTTYDVFRGFVQGWPQDYPGTGADSIVTLSCYDALGLLGGMRLPDDVMPEVVDDIATPWGWWRMGDTGSVLRDSSGNDRDATITTIGGALLPPPSQRLAAGLPLYSSQLSGQISGVRSKEIGTLSGQSLTVSAWIRTTSAGASTETTSSLLTWWNQVVADPIYSSFYLTDITMFHHIGLNSDGKVEARILAIDGSSVIDAGVVRSTRVVNDGQPHHVVVTATGNTVTLYVDGVSDTTVVDTTSIGFALGGRIVIAGPAGAMPTALGSGDFLEADLWWSGDLQDVIYWESALTAGDVEAVYNASVGRIEETSADRAIRLLDAVDWPSGLRDISTDCVARCGMIVYNRGNVLNALQLVEATENSALFAAKDGKVTLLPRYYWDTVTEGSTVQATFSDDGADIGYSDLRFTWDAEFIVNDLDVVPGEQNPRNASDATSIDAHGRRSHTINTVLAESDDAASMAHAVMLELKDPILRPDAIAVYPQRSPDDWWPLMLPLELGYRVQLERTPMGIGDAISQEAMVQEINHSIVPHGLWTIGLKASPRPLTAHFVLDTSELNGTDVLGY